MVAAEPDWRREVGEYLADRAGLVALGIMVVAVLKVIGAALALLIRYPYY